MKKIIKSGMSFALNRSISSLFVMTIRSRSAASKVAFPPLANASKANIKKTIYLNTKPFSSTTTALESNNINNHSNSNKVKLVKENTTTSNNEEPIDEKSIKGLITKYGPVAVVVYASMSISLLLLVFSTVSYFDIQKKDVIQFTNSALESINVNPESIFGKKFEQEADVEEPQGESSYKHILTKLAVSVLITKVFAPLKFAATFALTPRIGRYLHSRGILDPVKVQAELKKAKRRVKK